MEERHERRRRFLDELRQSPIAIETRAANEQHYEAPPEFFRLALGPRLKYSGCLWDGDGDTLARAEDRMLALTCERALVEDGQRILDLGCGWGSLTLWLLERYPRCVVTSVSNSAPQRRFILEEVERRGLDASRLKVVTADMNDFTLEERFDRVISVEMFEHMKNYRALLARISSMLGDDGRLFVHIFSHTSLAYHFEREGDWIGRHFFTGGTMPSDDLLFSFQEDLVMEDHWRVGGRHYERTANAWLANVDSQRERARAIMAEAHASADARAWLHRWRVFFIACAELWGLDGGSQWIVSHYRFRRR